MLMANPPHPGDSIRYDCLEPLGLTIKQAAEGLCVSPRLLSNIINGRASITADMAIRLTEAFGSSPETWLGMQHAYDLWQARHNMPRPKVTQFYKPQEWPEDESVAV